jgi:hypothetical protein
MGLTPEEIAGLMAKKRTKGLYEEKLVFLYNDTDEAGVDVAETWPVEFGAKTATTLYQGFSNAAKKLDMEDSVDIVNRDGHVFILVKSRVALVLADMDTNGNGASATEAVADATTELV